MESLTSFEAKTKAKEPVSIRILHTSYDDEPSRCGYCKKMTSRSIGYTFGAIDTEMVNSLLNRGFRRCGDYYYQFLEGQTCCEANIIRCDPFKFTPSNKQLKIARKFVRGKPQEVKTPETSDLRETCLCFIKEVLTANNIAYPKDIPLRLNKKGASFYSSSILVSLKHLKLTSTEEFNKMLVSANSRLNWELDKDILKIHVKIQEEVTKAAKTVPKDPISGLFTDQKLTKLGENCVLAVENPGFTEEKYQIYKEFEENQFEKEASKRGFKSFLCETEMYSHSEIEGDKLFKIKEHGLVHMTYRIDNKLEMVGVLDILSETVSSVYLFYSDKMRKFSPGVLSTQVEMEFTRYLNSIQPKIKHYSQGFFIPTNQKMVIKREYKPFELLSQLDYKFHPEGEKPTSAEKLETDFEAIPLSVKGDLIPFSVVRDCMISQNYRELVNNMFKTLVYGLGDALVSNLLFSLN